MIIITSSKYLYMANKLHQFAVFIAFCAEHNIKLYNPSFSVYAEHFECSHENFLCAYPAGKRGIVSIKRQQQLYHLLYKFALVIHRLKLNSRFIRVVDIGWDETQELTDPSFVQMAKRTRFLFVQGWLFQHPSGVSKYAKEIRTFLAPLARYSTKAAAFCKSLKEDKALLIGVHIRHGDFKTFMGGKYFYEIDIYKKYMEQLVLLFSGRKLRFLICSNASFKENEFAAFDFRWGLGDPMEDLFSLAGCDYIIGPPSTFSIWASFYGATPLCLLETKDMNITQNHFKIF